MISKWKSALAITQRLRLCRGLSPTSGRLSQRLFASSSSEKGGGIERLPPSLLQISDEVRAALESKTDRLRVVALETAVVSHGLPYYSNVEAALGMEDEIRIQGSIPATICVMDGKIHVGCSLKEMERLGRSEEPKMKVSRRDFAYALSQRINGGTTVAGTLVVAKALGIRLFATGGIGGVHRGGESSMDVSADLVELGRSPVAVVSAGIKSILDIPRTLEYLETQGVFVCTLTEETDTKNPAFPNFFVQESEVASPAVIRGEKAAADLIECHLNLGVDSGLLLAVPVPKMYENQDAAQAVSEAAAECAKLGIKGRDVTPFILGRIRERTGGSSVASNQALLLNNARVAGKIGALLADSQLDESRRQRMRAGNIHAIAEKPVEEQKPDPVVVIGAAALDLVVRVKDEIVPDGRTHWSVMQQTVGGVGRNIAQCLKELGCRPFFIASVGNDAVGKKVQGDLSHKLPGAGDSVKVLDAGATTSFVVVLDSHGQHYFEAGDAECLNQLSIEHVKQFEGVLQRAPLLVFDGNIPAKTMSYVLGAAHDARVPVFFEPTTSSLAHKPYSLGLGHCLTFASPNIAELVQMHAAVTATPNSGLTFEKSLVQEFQQNPSSFEELPFERKVNFLRPLVKSLFLGGSMEALLVTLGHDGLLVARRGQEVDAPLLPIPGTRRTDSAVSLTHYPVERLTGIVSVSGAGDCLSAGFAAAMLAGKNQHVCAAFGQLCARATLTSATTVPSDFCVPELWRAAETATDFVHVGSI